MNKDTKKEQNIKSLWISISLLAVFLVILFFGFLPKKSFKDTFLVASVIYSVFTIFWLISRFEAFTILKKVKVSVMRMIRSKETREYYNDKNEIKSSNIGLYVTTTISVTLLIASIITNIS